MTQTVLMFVASIWLVVLVALFQTENLRSAFVFKVMPALLSVGLSVFAFARVMGWPI